MPVDYSQYTNGDMRSNSGGDMLLMGVLNNTKPNLVKEGFAYSAINKRFVNGQAIDRGGHFATLFLNQTSDYPSKVPVAKPTIYGAVEYQNPFGVSQGIIFCGSNAYLVQPGTAATYLAYPAGVTISGPVHAVQAVDVLYVFLGDDKAPIQYNQSDINNTYNFTLVDQSTKTGGFLPMPQGKDAVYFNSRLWVLYKDVVYPSDIEDPNNYDEAAAFPIERGTNDDGVAILIYNSNTIIVFKQRSTYAITGIDDTLANTVLKEISLEFGATARDGVFSADGEVFFYSNGAIYPTSQLSTGNSDLKTSPVNWADDMAPLMSLINQAYAYKATSIVENNRLYFAVPINGSTENNAVFVYNFKNKAWEGYDQSTSTKFNVTQWLVLPFLGKQRLFAVSAAGYLFLYDYDDMDLTDTVSASEKYPATSELVTRGYCGTNSEFYGQFYGAGSLNKFAVSGAFQLSSFCPNFSIDILGDDAHNSVSVESGKTYNNTSYDIWGKSDWNATNVNNDYATPGRKDYSLNLQSSNGIYLQNGIYFAQRQNQSRPYEFQGASNYFQLRMRNTGGNTAITNIEFSVNAKENSYLKN